MPIWPASSRRCPPWISTGALDILLVAFVVYEALMVVRGTRAGHILIGILTMVSIYALASWAGLEALRSLLSFIVPYIGLAIIVLFQSEIRRTLARIGRKNWFGLAPGFRAPEALSEIMMAVGAFLPPEDRRADRPGTRHRPAHLRRKRRAPGIPHLARYSASPFSSPACRCTMAPSSFRRIASRRPPVSCR